MPDFRIRIAFCFASFNTVFFVQGSNDVIAMNVTFDKIREVYAETLDEESDIRQIKIKLEFGNR